MQAKILFVLFFMLFLGGNVFSAEEKIEVSAKKTDVPVGLSSEEFLTLIASRQAITNELVKGGLVAEAFWKKITDKNLAPKDEMNFLKPLFNQLILSLAAEPTSAAPATENTDILIHGTLTYDLDPTKVKTSFNEAMSELPDPAIKTFYIVPEIAKAKEMSWIDVGVTKEENFSGVIIESWKKWASTQFKSFANVVVLPRDFTTKPGNINPESVTLKWISFLKKGEAFPDRKSARFDLSAQYVLVNTKTGQSLLAFDFPTQKREFSVVNPKELSSNLASLVYNLLNSQTAKLVSNVELSRASGALTTVDIKVVGKHGLFDITQINAFLGEHFKDITLTSELKSYASESSVISIKSTLLVTQLFDLLAKDGGKFLLNEQKILLFSSENKTFAIIPKEANN